MKYLCSVCGMVFDEPARVPENFDEYGLSHAEVCPSCGEEYFEEARECRKCGKYTASEDGYCTKCKADLANRFRAFLDELTAEDEEMLDILLDGNSVANVYKN